MRLRRFAVLVLSFWLVAVCAYGAGPRWVAGSQWQNAGQIMNWYTPNVQYFVDAGPLSGTVDHAAAVALVDAAAAVWNVPGVGFTLKNGGGLAEDVSSGTVYLGANGPVWPADVQSSAYTAKQIAVVLDADGSLTDMLLGAGASSAGNCRQNGVTESVDLFIQPGKIAHAVVILNGLCTGSAAAQQTQMQYQLLRAFGRVIGLGWSQLNDNVFTYATQPSATQLQNWPVMHPIDILCGPYTYQCMASPFVLRTDDIAALAMVCTPGVMLPGTFGANGFLGFSTGEGMRGLNVVARRAYRWSGYTDDAEMVSSVAGFQSGDAMGNPVTGAGTDTRGLTGVNTPAAVSQYRITNLPLLTDQPYTNLLLSTQALNPLYIGAYAVGPYRSAQVTPSGSAWTYETDGVGAGADVFAGGTIPNSATDCNTASDGTENAPAKLAAGGTWGGLLCAMGHTVWNSFAVKAGRAATIEVTAQDETFAATAAKALPLVGVWHGNDATGTLPTMGATPSAMNSTRTGMTQLRVAFGTSETVRMAIADARGDGRPDFFYKARVLYADTVTPSRMPAAGGTIRILGTGFAPGNGVLVGGVLAQVTSLTPNEIDAIAPAAAALGGTAVNDVVVKDYTTGGTATITGGLTYAGASTDAVSFAVAPGAGVATGAAMPFALKVVDASGNAAGYAQVTVAVSGAGAVVNACGLATCTVATDASGVVSLSATAAGAGTVSLRASIASGSAVTASWTALAVAKTVVFARPVEYVAAGAGALFNPAVVALNAGAAAGGQGVAWSTASQDVAFGSATNTVTAADGTSAIHSTGLLKDGELVTVQACAWGVVCATQSVIGVPAANLSTVVTGGGTQSVTASSSLGSVSFRVVDTAGHPVAGAAVVVYQLVDGWQAPCPVSGRCPPAPVYGSSSTPAMSDDDGNVVVAPLQYANTAGVTKMTAVVGTIGETTVVLEKTP